MAIIDNFGVRLEGVQAFVDGLTARVRRVWGDSADLSPDTRQTQLIGVIAAALADHEGVIADLYNAAGIQTATGAALDALSAMLGVHRHAAASSTATVRFTGTNGTNIPAGTLVRSSHGDLFATDEAVAIVGTAINAEVTAQAAGPVRVDAGTLTSLASSVSGVSGVTNAAAGVQGREAETDTAFRRRYFRSLALNALGSRASLEAALLATPGVLHAVVRDNPSGAAVTTRGLTIGANGVICVVEGGTDAAVAKTIADYKPIGIPTSGAVSVNVPLLGGDGSQTERTRFQRLETINLRVGVQIATDADWPNDGGVRVQAAAYDLLSQLAPGETPEDQHVRAVMLNAAPGFTITSIAYTDRSDGSAIPATLDLDRRLQPSLEHIVVTTT